MRMGMSTAATPPHLRPAVQAKRQQVTQRGPLIQANFRAATKALMNYFTSPAMTKILTDKAWER